MNDTRRNTYPQYADSTIRVEDFVSRACAQLKSRASQVIVGSKDERVCGYEAEVRTTAAGLGLHNWPAIVGHIERAAKQANYDLAVVFKFWSPLHNFGSSCRERWPAPFPLLMSAAEQVRYHRRANIADEVADLPLAGYRRHLGTTATRQTTTLFVSASTQVLTVIDVKMESSGSRHRAFVPRTTWGRRC